MWQNVWMPRTLSETKSQKNKTKHPVECRLSLELVMFGRFYIVTFHHVSIDIYFYADLFSGVPIYPFFLPLSCWAWFSPHWNRKFIESKKIACAVFAHLHLQCILCSPSLSFCSPFTLVASFPSPNIILGSSPWVAVETSITFLLDNILVH